MIIVGCDFHPGWQQVAVFDSATGEIREQKLENGNGTARQLDVKRPFRSTGTPDASEVWFWEVGWACSSQITDNPHPLVENWRMNLPRRGLCVASLGFALKFGGYPPNFIRQPLVARKRPPPPQPTPCLGRRELRWLGRCRLHRTPSSLPSGRKSTYLPGATRAHSAPGRD